jgi:hypothetical protein
MNGSVLLTYRPLAERDAAAQIGARLAARFGERRIVFVSRLRPERFAASRAVVALLARGDNTPEFNRWLSDLRVAVQAGVPVALVLMDGAAQPPAQVWPDDPAIVNAAVISLSTFDLDRGVDRLMAILAPLVGADPADRIPEPTSTSIEERNAGRNAGETTTSDEPGTDLRDSDLPEILDDDPAEPDYAELESLAQNKFAPRPAPSAPVAALEPPPSPPRPPQPPSGPAAEPARPASDRAPASGLQAVSWAPPPMRPLAAARMPDSAPWPAAIRPTDRGFATMPLSAASVAAPQPGSAADPHPIEGSRSRGGVWLATLGVVVVVAGVALAYVFRNEIAALIDPIASNLFHRATPRAS